MVLVYFIVGLLNIFSQHHNYGIKIEDPNIDIRVRRSIEDAVKPEVFNLENISKKDVLKTDILKTDVLKTDVLKTDVLKTDILKTDVLKREKRYAYYKKTTITHNDLLKYNTNNNSESQTLKNRYDIFNPNYNFLFNTTRNNQNNNTGVKNGITINRRPFIRSYPYGYPSGYERRPNRATGYNVVTTTPGYRNQNDNTPVFYNYQNPNGPNFAGYGGYTAKKAGYENFTPGYYNAPLQYEPRSSPSTTNYPWNSALASYPPSYTQTTINNKFPTANNSGIHSLPYNNNFNNIPVPFNKDNLPQYAINFNNGTIATNNTYSPYIAANNTSVTPRDDYIFPSINDYNLPSNNTNVSPTNSNNNVSPTNSNNNVSPTNNANVTPSNVNSTVTTTPKTLYGCVICNIPCPQFMRRFGMLCMPDNSDDDDYGN